MEGGDDRYYSMSITSFGPSTLPRNKHTDRQPPIETRTINNTNDIEGATRTTTLFERYGNKPSFLQSDIPGSSPMALTHSRNCRDNSLYVDDIEGTRAKALDKMATTKRRVNPLEPDYPLPSFIPVEPHEPKFIRHTMDITDIDGSATQPLKRQIYAPRDSYLIDDIVGAQPNWKPRHERVTKERPPKDIMDIGDICKKTHRWVDRTSRQSDPNAPVYHVNGMGYYDDPLGTKPTKPKPFINENMLLVTKDIMSGTGYPMYRERRDHSRTNYCADIEGALPDTIRHAIVTNRRTNPLVPVYQGLDYGDPLPPLLVPLLPSSMVVSPTLRPKLDPADMDTRPKESISKMGDRSSAGAAISGHGGPTADYHWSYTTFRDYKDGRHMTASFNTANQSHGHGGSNHHGSSTAAPSSVTIPSNQETHNQGPSTGGGQPQFTDYYASNADNNNYNTNYNNNYNNQGDDELVLFTKPPLAPPSTTGNRIKLDLDIHSGRSYNNNNASPSMSGRTGGGGGGAGGSGGRYKPSPRPGSLGSTGPLHSNRGPLPAVGLGQGLNSGRNSGRAKTAALPGTSGGEIRAARELQAEIDAVRAL